MKTSNAAGKLIAVIAIAISTPQISYTQSTRPKDVNVVNTPNVNIANTPSVSLEARAAVGINPSNNTVKIASSPANSVLTTQFIAVKNIFQKPLEIDLVEGQVLGFTSFTVPAGKLLAIEQVSGLALMGGVNQFPTVSFRTTANNSLAEYVLVSPFPNGPAQYPVFTFGNASIYADPGSTVQLIYKREGENQTFGTSELKVTFSGHYINQ